MCTNILLLRVKATSELEVHVKMDIIRKMFLEGDIGRILNFIKWYDANYGKLKPVLNMKKIFVLKLKKKTNINTLFQMYFCRC